ncbi:MAG: preprotein translocase subunit SecE [Arenicella sp.]|jgi:preprotein translocase subunit SecE
MFKKLKDLIKESYNEMVNHVTWTPFAELQKSSIMVLIASLIFALVIYVMDLGVGNALELFYSIK